MNDIFNITRKEIKEFKNEISKFTNSFELSMNSLKLINDCKYWLY